MGRHGPVHAGLGNHRKVPGTPSGLNVVSTLLEHNHNQPGDPAKAAAAIVTLAAVADPPLRIQLGADSVARVEAKLRLVQQELTTWRTLSVSTDHDTLNR